MTARQLKYLVTLLAQAVLGDKVNEQPSFLVDKLK